jgi:deoxynucleoside triphosphate triphosphohydrolase SAMHD1
VDAETTVSRLRPLFDNLAGAVDVVAFSPTSGAQIQNWLRKELRDDPRLRFPADLRAALKEGRDGPIVFVDDNAASGVQARAQFLSILNVPREKWPLDCLKEDDLFSPMTVEEINAFRERDVYLYVCAGLPSAGRVINECLERNGFNNFCGLNCAEEIDTHEWSAELRQFLSDVGKHLIGWSRFETQYEALSSSRRAYCKKHAFGYGNAGGMVATTLSVPTATVTPIWCPGLYKGQPWMPLLLRTNKLKYLVVG